MCENLEPQHFFFCKGEPQTIFLSLKRELKSLYSHEFGHTHGTYLVTIHTHAHMLANAHTHSSVVYSLVHLFSIITWAVFVTKQGLILNSGNCECASTNGRQMRRISEGLWKSERFAIDLRWSCSLSGPLGLKTPLSKSIQGHSRAP